MLPVKPYLDNRELSWLKFNERVLEEAMDKSVQLFERLRFISIFSSNLDEFFMIRVGSLYDRTLLNNFKVDNKTMLTAEEQLELISAKVKNLIVLKDAAYNEIMSEFNERNILEHITKYIKDDEKYLKNIFVKDILPLLSPSIIDKKHPPQFMKNKEIYVNAILKRKNEEDEHLYMGIVSASSSNVLNRIIFLPSINGKLRYTLCEDLIFHFTHLVFGNFIVLKKSVFRITRNADIDVNEALFDQDLDFRGVMEELLKKRKKLAPVRIEFGCKFEKEYREKLIKKINIVLKKDFFFLEETPLDFTFVEKLADKLKDHKELFYKPLKPQFPEMIVADEPLLAQIEQHDILISYPYEKFRPVIQLIEEASKDESVVSIKITLYRVATQSKVIDALIYAAESGKDVLALVELRARFDEENNISWSKRLEEAGVQVIYGLDDLKVHSKLILITKKTGKSIRYYTHVGTGNYNERTSTFYTDYSLLTCNKDIGTDASMIFNALSVGSTVESTNALWVAPRALKSRIIEMIDTEITYKADGYIGIKINSLTDRDIIEKLVEAGKKGVKIELLVRGICCLIAGVKGETENIKVGSVVGRLLEHSRVYIFGKGDRQKIYISSADFMTRNTERRVEVAAPVKDKYLRDKIVAMFDMLFKNNIKLRLQNSYGFYIKEKQTNMHIDTQEYFFEEAYNRAENAQKKSKQLKKHPFISFFVKHFKRKNNLKNQT